MKRLGLALGIVVIVASTGFCDVITFDSSATMSRSFIINTFNTSYDNQNGNIDGDNIKDGGIVSDDISTAANPLIRDNENIGEYVYTGLTIATSVDLDSIVAAGTAYVTETATGALHRVVKDATAKTFTASKDTWVYLQYTGAFTYDEQALGASQPITPDNSTILAKVVTDGDNITSVVDYRQTTPPNLRIYTDTKTGLVISRDVSDVDKIGIGRGEIEFVTEGSLRRNIVSADINFGTTGIGALDTGSLAKGYVFLYAVADPDNSANFKGIGSASAVASTVKSNASLDTTPRLVGWAYATDTNTISPDALGAYRGRGGDAPNVYEASQSGLTMTHTARTHIVLHKAKFYSSGRPAICHYGFSEGSGGGQEVLMMAEISVDSTSLLASQRYNEPSNGAINTAGGSYMTEMSEGEHDIELTATSLGANADTIRNWYLIVQEQ